MAQGFWNPAVIVNRVNKVYHNASWRYPRSNHWRQLDLVTTRRDSLNNVCNTRAYHNAQCDTDHSLISSKIKLKCKNLYYSKKNTTSNDTISTYGKKKIHKNWFETNISTFESVINAKRTVQFKFERDTRHQNLQTYCLFLRIFQIINLFTIQKFIGYLI